MVPASVSSPYFTSHKRVKVKSSRWEICSPAKARTFCISSSNKSHNKPKQIDINAIPAQIIQQMRLASLVSDFAILCIFEVKVSDSNAMLQAFDKSDTAGFLPFLRKGFL